MAAQTGLVCAKRLRVGAFFVERIKLTLLACLPKGLILWQLADRVSPETVVSSMFEKEAFCESH